MESNENIKLLQPSKIKMSKQKVYFILTMAAILSAFSTYYFIVAAQLYVPGLAGLSNGISYTINDLIGSGNGEWIGSRSTADTIIYWIFYSIFNVPIIYLTIRWYSKRFFLLSLYFFLINFIFSMFFSNVPGFNQTILDINNEDVHGVIVFIFSIVGGVVYGISVGLAFKVGACTLGLDPIAKFISREHDVNIAPILFTFTIINTTIWTIVRFFTIPGQKEDFMSSTFLSPEYIGSWLYIGAYSVVTGTIYASNKKVQLFVTTEKTNEISNFFNSINYHRGHTIFNVEGGYSKTQKRSILMIVNIGEMYDVVEKIAAIDGRAFITIHELKKVYDIRDWRSMTDEDKKKTQERMHLDFKKKKKYEKKTKCKKNENKIIKT